ncbi:MAG TPA: hypothetical protein DGR79_01455 [Clostridiales bacterium]|nr:hypothetical protein [Clostridiales bacterium]
MSAEVRRRVEGELVRVLEDDLRNPLYWFQPSGTRRVSVGAQVFLDRRRRTRAVTEGDEVLPFRGPSKKEKE